MLVECVAAQFAHIHDALAVYLVIKRKALDSKPVADMTGTLAAVSAQAKEVARTAGRLIGSYAKATPRRSKRHGVALYLLRNRHSRPIILHSNKGSSKSVSRTAFEFPSLARLPLNRQMRSRSNTGTPSTAMASVCTLPATELRMML